MRKCIHVKQGKCENNVVADSIPIQTGWVLKVKHENKSKNLLQKSTQRTQDIYKK